MRPLAVAFVAVSVVSAVGCGERRPTFDDAAKPVEVRTGTEFVLALKSNQSTGYRWVMVDSAALGAMRFVRSDYQSNHPNRNGAGGSERWTFAAPTAGVGVVSLVYKRPWERTVPKDTTRFRVTVR
jgi:inhibitor of cysteine peptidase